MGDYTSPFEGNYNPFAALQGLLDKEMPRVRKAMEQVLSQIGRAPGESVHAGGLKSKLKDLLPGFNERDHGAKTFVAFLDAHAAELGLRVERLSSGTVRVVWAGAAAEGEAPEGNGESGAEPDLEDARDLLERAFDALDTGAPIHLGGLKETMLRISPSFSERALGYKRFLDFVKDQDDMVEMEQVSPKEWGVVWVPEE